MCTSTVSALRMPPGLAVPASSRLQHPATHLQMSSQPGSVQIAVPPNEAGWLKHAELTEELTGAGRCHAVVASGNPHSIGGRDNVISSGQYQQSQQQQQALPVSYTHLTLPTNREV